MSIPVGMTAEKLREIAEWLDLYDWLAERFILENSISEVVDQEALNAVRGNDIQDDLRRWADEIDGLL